ncbi:substrate-binding domain-containing protein [Paracraurococcus ruber]|uniref:ABC transporter substrate-binding protein n=1 Tax=Paracraurococcus ruber TaxID=77675 RepID=A0ABS1D4H7_9PROT|nr:substrate-binding domain-containing protein [Paracraurococcus ruber]MBK1661770.1 hypothetical protein [Paracraurococcus ruber]TDG22209.1 ABC transporter substrate-binding protein [Paracraurococcus ruber]
MEADDPAARLAVLSTLGVMEAFKALAPGFEAARGLRVVAEFAPTQRLLARIAAGERAALAILTAEAVEALVAQGVLAPGSRVDIARSFVGAAVRAGAARPAIGTEAEFRQALLAARSIAYSRAGASGIFFAGLIRRLGIEAEVNAKATIIPEGLTGALAARGEAELAIQQVSELMAVPGIDILGRLPPALGGVAVFSGAVFAGARPEAAALLAHLTAPAHRGLYVDGGLEPAF